jgi:chromosome segregation ATPase
LHTRSELEDRLCRCYYSEEELKRKVKELTKSYEKKKHKLTESLEKKKHKLHEVKEKLSKTRHEKEELQEKVKKLEEELHEKHCHWDNAEERCGKWKLEWEDCHREYTSLNEEYQRIEIERTELQKTVTTKTEEHQVLLIEKKHVEKEFHDKCKECKDLHREIVVLKDLIRCFKSTIKEKSELIHTLHERIERVERNRDKAHRRCKGLEVELSSLRSTIISLKVDIETMTTERDAIYEKCRDFKCKYKEISTSLEEYHSSNGYFKQEIFELRAMLHKACEEREKAITMRMSVDRERDKATSRFKLKCREMDKLEERLAQTLHGHGHHHGGHQMSERITYRSVSSATAVVKSDDE